jgi:hypothetical protein
MATWDEKIEEVDEPILRRALVQFVPRDGGAPWWGALLRTNERLHVLYGSEPGWFGKLVKGVEAEHHSVSISIDEIHRIELPRAKQGLLSRIFSPPLQTARLELETGDEITLQVDGKGRELLLELEPRVQIDTIAH